MAGAYPGFCSVKQLRVLTPPDGIVKGENKTNKSATCLT